MGNASRIKWNSLFLFLSTIIRLGTNFLLFVGIARLYGPEAFGQFTTAHTLSLTFILVADFGFDMLLATEIARDRSNAARLAKQFFAFKLISITVAVSAMVLLSVLQHFSPATRLLVQIFSFYILFSSINTFFFGFFKGMEQLQHETKISFIMNSFLLCFLVLFGFLRLPLYSIAVLFVGSRIIGILLCLRIASQNFGLHLSGLSLQRWRDTWHRVLIFGMHFVFGNLFFMLDTILLAFWKGDREVGVYQAVFKIVVLALIIPDIVVNTIMPVLARLHVENVEQWKRVGLLLNKTLFFCAIPISAVLFLYSEQILAIVYGPKVFDEAVPLLRIFSAVVFVRFVVEPSALMMTTSHRQSKRMLLVLFATILNFALNAYAIPRYGTWGASIVSLITNALVGMGYIVANHSLALRWLKDIRNIILSVFAVLMVALLWQIRDVALWYVVPMAIVIFAGVSYYVGYSKEERVLLFTSGRMT